MVRERGGGESDEEQREQSNGKDRSLQLRHLRRGEEREHSVIRQIISSVCSVLCESRRRGEERQVRQHTVLLLLTGDSSEEEKKRRRRRAASADQWSVSVSLYLPSSIR